MGSKEFILLSLKYEVTSFLRPPPLTVSYRWHLQSLAEGISMEQHVTPAMQETQVRSLGREHPPEKEIATHSSILVWRISWREEPGGL